MPKTSRSNKLLENRRQTKEVTGDHPDSKSNILNASQKRLAALTRIAKLSRVKDLRRNVKSKLWIKNPAFMGRLRKQFKVRSTDQLNVWPRRGNFYVEVTSADYARGKYFRVTDPRFVKALKQLFEEQQKGPHVH